MQTGPSWLSVKNGYMKRMGAIVLFLKQVHGILTLDIGLFYFALGTKCGWLSSFLIGRGRGNRFEFNILEGVGWEHTHIHFCG